MSLEVKHWAVVAGLLTGVATQLLTVQHGWADIATPGFVAGLMIQVATVISAIFVGAPGATAALDRANRNTDLANESVRAALDPPPDPAKLDPKRFIGTGTGALLLACVLAGGAVSACASARQVAITADQSFATAVFAIDDAEWAAYQACKPAPACEARHAKLNPVVKQALADVKAVTAAIKAVPSGMPSSLPDLLKDLLHVQEAIRAIDAVIPGLAEKTAAAETKALALLAQFVGGK